MEGGSVSPLTQRNHFITHSCFTPQTQESVGMIPRAVDQVFTVTEDLKSKGWIYKLEGQFLEIVQSCLYAVQRRILTFEN